MSLRKRFLRSKREFSGNAPQMFVGYDIKLEKQIVGETRLHNDKYGCPRDPFCASLLNHIHQLIELLAMVEHER